MKSYKKIINNEYFWFILIILLGIFLRIYKLDSIPPGFTGDEAWLGLDGQEIIHKGWIGIYIPSHAWGYQALHAYFAAFLIKIFGASILAVRLASAIPGIFSLIAFYFLAKEFFSKHISLILLTLVSISYWHIHFSRIAFPGIILVLLFSILSVFFLLKALKTKRIYFFAITGIALGLGVNSYHYFNFSLIAFTLFLIILILSKKDFLKTYFWKLGLMSSIFLLVILPYLIFVLNHPSDIKGKWEYTNTFIANTDVSTPYLKKLDLFKSQTLKTTKIFFLKGDTDELDGPSGIPLFDNQIAVLFIVGLIITLLYYKKNFNLLVILWFIFALSVGIITTGAPNSKRIIDTLPAVFIFIGYALKFLKQGIPRKYFILLTTLIIGLNFYTNYNIYFKDYAKSSIVGSRFAYEVLKMCEFLNQETSSYIYFYHPRTDYNYLTRQFLCPNIQGEDRSYEYGQYSLEINNNFLPARFIYVDHYRSILPELKQKYPNGELKEFNNWNGEFLFGSYLVEKNGL